MFSKSFAVVFAVIVASFLTVSCSSQSTSSSYASSKSYKPSYVTYKPKTPTISKEERRKRAIKKACNRAKVTSGIFSGLTIAANMMASMGSGGSAVQGGMDGAKLANKEVWVQGVKYACP